MSAEPSARPTPLVHPWAPTAAAELLPSPTRLPRFPPSKCPCCGRRGLRPTRELGRALRYRNMGLALLSKDLRRLEELNAYWAFPLASEMPSLKRRQDL